MRQFEHYGVPVIYQWLKDRSFKNELKKKGIEYIELPLIDHVILKYKYENNTRYALIVSCFSVDEYCEDVYVTERIPDDMSWENLVQDVSGQKSGKPPMKMKTKKDVVYEKARDLAGKWKERQPDYDMWKDVVEPPTDEEIEYAVHIMGYDFSDDKIK